MPALLFIVSKVSWAWVHPQEMAAMGRAARREFEQKYTAEDNYRQLMAAYQTALTRKRKR